MSRIITNIMRLAVITDVNHSAGIAYTKWLDQDSDEGPSIPIPHPFAGKNGEGIYVGLKTGNIVVLSMLSAERYVPVLVLPIPGAYGDLTSVNESHFDDVGVPYLESGDIVIQGSNAGQLRFDDNGDISLFNSFDEGIKYSGYNDNSVRCSIETTSPSNYKVLSSGIKSSGIIRRDVRLDDEEGNYVNFLTDVSSEQMLEEIGWDITKQVTYVSRDSITEGLSDVNNKKFRNPAYVENREVVFEFGREWSVGNFQNELDSLQSDLISVNDPDARRERRSNVLSLSLSHPNELIEKIEGTLVDVFGNLLTINKNILPEVDGNGERFLENIFEVSRHTVALHTEINTRKGLAYREGITDKRKPVLLKGAPDPLISANNARDRSRWAFRVDKEGLTTVNIPATSETGNIPLLTRQETSSILDVDSSGIVKGKRDDKETAYLYRNSNNQDIFNDQFGPGGIKIPGPSFSQVKNRLKDKKTSWLDVENTQATLPEFVEAGTAFHEITQTALTLLQENINKDAYDIFNDSDTYPDLPAVSPEVDSRIPTPGDNTATRDEITGNIINQPNAGGRSVQVNLDGSLEASLGANTVDRVSLILDTAGAIVTRLGRDRLGRSAIIQSDGSIAVEVGGFDYVGEGADDTVDTRFVGRGEGRDKTLPSDQKRFKSGKVVIRLRRANPNQSGPDPDDTLLILDDTGVTIKTVGRLNLVSEEDMTLQSGSRILLESPIVQIYENNPKFIPRDGRNI